MAHQQTGEEQRAHPVSFSPVPDPEQDLTPSDSQPPGVDDEPQSLEEALLG